jgi:hypothetical protein
MDPIRGPSAMERYTCGMVGILTVTPWAQVSDAGGTWHS